MLRPLHLILISAAAVLAMLAIPVAPPTAAAPSPCGDLGFTISWAGGSVTDDSSVKFDVPVSTELTITVTRKKASLAGKELSFSSPNQFLQLIPGSISDGGVARFNLPQQRSNVNFIVRWADGGDGVVTFKAMIHPDNLLFGNPQRTRGALMTIGARIQGGVCGAKIEINGVPGGGGPAPEPGPCPGITLVGSYSTNGGQTFLPLIEISQGANSQFAGPRVGDLVRYVITPSVPTAVNQPLTLTVSTNRQQITSAPGGTISADKKKVVFPWTGQTLTAQARALTTGLDTVTFVARNPARGNAVVSLCSTHLELRIAAR
jgi:hypothetical protein